MENFAQAHRIIDEIQESLFPRLESCRESVQSQAIEGAIDERIKQVETILDKMEIAVNKATMTQRTTLKLKLDQLRYDHKHLLSSFRTLHQRRLAREREQRERDELLTRRFTTNAQANSQIDTQIQMGHEEFYHNERDRLMGANRHIDEMLATGSAVLSSLRDQGGMMRSVRSRLQEVDATLGLSQSVVRLIGKRAHTDKFVLYGLMICFTIFMFLVWKYLT